VGNKFCSCVAQYAYRFATRAGTLEVSGPLPAHAPWTLQIGGKGNDTATSVAIDSAEPEKGLGHTVIAGWTDSHIMDPVSARLKAESDGLHLQWEEGRSPNDFIQVRCVWLQQDGGSQQWSTTCTYPRLAFQSLNLSNLGGKDGWVAKVAYNGSQLWKRQIGSSGDDQLNGVAVARGDHTIVVGGSTTNNMLPVVPISIDTRNPFSMSGGSDCFIVKLDQFGEYLGAAQFGSTGDDWVSAVAVDRGGGILLAVTRSEQILGHPPQGGLDSMMVKFAPDMTFLWAGLVGSEKDDVLSAMVLYEGADGKEHAVAAGTTRWPYFGRHKGGADIIVVIYGTGDIAADVRGLFTMAHHRMIFPLLWPWALMEASLLQVTPLAISIYLGNQMMTQTLSLEAGMDL